MAKGAANEKSPALHGWHREDSGTGSGKVYRKRHAHPGPGWAEYAKSFVWTPAAVEHAGFDVEMPEFVIPRDVGPGTSETNVLERTYLTKTSAMIRRVWGAERAVEMDRLRTEQLAKLDHNNAALLDRLRETSFESKVLFSI